MNKVLVNFVLVLLICSGNFMKMEAQSDASLAMAKLISAPDEFDSYKRVEIFNNYIAQYYSKGMDSVMIKYDQMEDFGIEKKDSFVIGMAITSKASINKMNGKNRETFSQLINATKFLKSNPNEYLRNLAAVGTEATILGEYEIAKEYIDLAFEQQDIYNNAASLTELHLVKGAYYESQTQFHSALTEYLKAMEFRVDELSPIKVANIYLNISRLYHQLNDQEKAFLYLKDVEKIVVENGYKLTANTLDLRKGAYYMKAHQFDKAKKHYTASLDYLQEKEIAFKLLNVYANLSIIDLELGDFDGAKHYINLAVEQSDSTITNSGKSALYNAKYRYAQAIGDYSGSKAPLLDLLALAEQTDNYNKTNNAYTGLIKLNEHHKDWKQVATYQNKLIELVNEKNIASQKALLYDLDNKYQNEQKELEIKGLQIENQLSSLELSQKKKENRLYLGLLFLAILALLALRYAYTSIKKINSKLSVTNNQLSKALDVNKMLLKEIHHRVKNNLQVISSLLGLQQAYLSDSEAKKAIQTSKTRVQSMSLLHQKLYQGEDITKVNIKEYFENLTLNLFQTYKVDQDKIELHQNIEPLIIDVDTVITMGLIFNELISNALKYAFEKEENGIIHVSVSQVGNKINMRISDNGKGVTFNELPKRSKSLGMNLVRSFTTKLQGEIDIDNLNGTRFEIAFPIQNKVA